MLQQIIALVVICFFIFRLLWQKKEKKISGNEFIFWLIFWLLAAGAIIFLRQIDALAANLGFSGSGIDILVYCGILILFYFVIRLRLKSEKMDREITKIVRAIASKKNRDEQ